MFFDPAYQSLKNGLVGYWSPVATGPTGLQLLDLSGQNNHGTLTNMDAPTDWVDSPYGTVLNFDGVNDRVETGAVTRSLTISLAVWVKIDYANSDTFARIVEHGLNQSITINLNKNAIANKLFLQLGDGNSDINWTTDVTSNWEHFGVAIAHSGGINTYSLYRNGVFDKAGTKTVTPSGSYRWFFGGGDPSVTNITSSAAEIADVCVFNRALTASEVQTLYNLGPGKLIRSKPTGGPSKRKWWPGVKTPKSRPIIPTQRGIKSGSIFYDPKASWFKNGLVGHWCPNLTGPTGTQLLDLSGQNNNGTLTNMDAPTDWVQTEKKLALDFDGTDDRVVNTTSSIYTFGTGNFSFGGWFYTNATTAAYAPLITTWSGTSPNSAFLNKWFLGFFDTRIRVFDSAGGIAITYIQTNGVWNHYVVSRIAGVITLYVDGVSQGTYSGANQNFSADGAVSIGGTASSFASIRCAEAFVSRNGLTASEVQTLYSFGPGGFAARKPYRNKLSYSPAPKKIFKSRIDRKRSVSLVHPDQDNQWVTNGLVGFWCPSLTGATGTQLLDLSGQNNNGTLTNMDAPTDWVDSAQGLALDFDGTNDIVTLGRIANFGKIHTFNCWMKTSDTSYILAGHVSTSNWYAFLQDSGLFYYNSGGSFVNVSGTANDNTWKMITVVRNGTSVSFYRDAIQIGATQTLSANNDLLIEAIGGYNNVTTLFAGQIAGQSFHSRELTPSEIQTLYQLGPRMGFSRRPSRSPTWMVEADETIGNRRRRIICGGKN